MTISVSVPPVAAPAVAPGVALPAGPAGPNPYAIAVMLGFAGDLQDWMASLAYQTAVAAGFVGTLEQWVASLRGPGGRGITGAALENGHLSVTFSDGEVVDLGSVEGPPGASTVAALRDAKAAFLALNVDDPAQQRTVLGAAGAVAVAARFAAIQPLLVPLDVADPQFGPALTALLRALAPRLPQSPDGLPAGSPWLVPPSVAGDAYLVAITPGF